jgi:hypothetical protein
MFKFVLFLILLGVIILASIQFAPVESLALVKAIAEYVARMATETYQWVAEVISSFKEQNNGAIK